MTRKTSIIEALGSYFASKGGVMTAEEYKQQEDTPIRFQLIKRSIGSWNRVLNMIGDLEQYVEEKVEEVIEKIVEPKKPAPKQPAETKE